MVIHGIWCFADTINVKKNILKNTRQYTDLKINSRKKLLAKHQTFSMLSTINNCAARVLPRRAKTPLDTVPHSTNAWRRVRVQAKGCPRCISSVRAHDRSLKLKGPSTLATLFSHRWPRFCGGPEHTV